MIEESKFHGIADVTDIGKSTVHEIISYLNYHKVSAHWIMKMFIEERKAKELLLHLRTFTITDRKGNP
jgi:hypothetical protein